ncbi:MAG: hypothetical protein VW333_05795 [Pseudomonadales bacterium]|jgi:hypothetical protein
MKKLKKKPDAEKAERELVNRGSKFFNTKERWINPFDPYVDDEEIKKELNTTEGYRE